MAVKCRGKIRSTFEKRIKPALEYDIVIYTCP